MPTYAGEYKQLWATIRMDPTGEAPEPMRLEGVQAWLKAHHRFGQTPEHLARMDLIPPRGFKIHAGHFLIDRDGIVRWVQIETPIDDVSRYGQFPSDEEILTAAHASLGAR
jgi:hypothetical protein